MMMRIVVGLLEEGRQMICDLRGFSRLFGDLETWVRVGGAGKPSPTKKDSCDLVG